MDGTIQRIQLLQRRKADSLARSIASARIAAIAYFCMFVVAGVLSVIMYTSGGASAHLTGGITLCVSGICAMFCFYGTLYFISLVTTPRD